MIGAKSQRTSKPKSHVIATGHNHLQRLNRTSSPHFIIKGASLFKEFLAVDEVFQPDLLLGPDQADRAHQRAAHVVGLRAKDMFGPDALVGFRPVAIFRLRGERFAALALAVDPIGRWHQRNRDSMARTYWICAIFPFCSPVQSLETRVLLHYGDVGLQPRALPARLADVSPILARFFDLTPRMLGGRAMQDRRQRKRGAERIAAEVQGETADRAGSQRLSYRVSRRILRQVDRFFNAFVLR